MNKQDFLEAVNNFKEANERTYNDVEDRILADFNHEVSLVLEYEGRQLLEMLQNADDAQSNKVKIEWIPSNKIISISNVGIPFTIEGIKSIMMANLSPKNKKTYIGNKGLGFRSILNWAEQINIYCQGCKITFSEKIVTDFYNNLILSSTFKNTAETKAKESSRNVAVAILSIPTIESSAFSEEEWVTKIEIKYYENFKNDIKEQIDNLPNEILLFLNHITTIQISEEGKDDIFISCNKIRIDNNIEEAMIGNNKWTIISDSDNIDTDDNYSLKVAFKDDLSDGDKKLFNFFPTQVSIHLPCLIHGTFELNISRNNLINSQINLKLLTKLSALLRVCANYLCKRSVSWLPYYLLTPSNKDSDSTYIQAFYLRLELLRGQMPIYPTIGKKYLVLKDVFFYDNDFSKLCAEFDNGSFYNLLQPLEVYCNIYKAPYSYEEFKQKVNISSQNIGDIDKRVEFIYLIHRHYKDANEMNLSLLINKQGDIISETAFIPFGNTTFHVPSFVELQFISEELYSKLKDKLRIIDARELQRTLKSIVNIQSSDITGVINRILPVKENKHEEIKEAVSCLFLNYISSDYYNNGEKFPIIKGKKIYLIANNGVNEDAATLLFGVSYPSGKIAEMLYEDKIDQGNFLLSIDQWGFDTNSTSNSDIERFFNWLGVNKYILKSYVDISVQQHEYFRYLFSHKYAIRPQYLEDWNLKHDDQLRLKIQNIDLFNNLSIENILMLIYLDDKVKTELTKTEDQFTWVYNTRRNELLSTCTFIKYQLLNVNIIKEINNYVIEESGNDIQKYINNINIDYSFFDKIGLKKEDANFLLHKLGAKTSTAELGVDRLYEILYNVPKIDEQTTGKGVQSLYKLIREILVKKDCPPKHFDDLLLFSKKDGKGEYITNTKVYYWDNDILPQTLLNTLFRIDLPKRLGEDSVQKYFEIRLIKEQQIKISNQSIQYDLNKEFDIYFQKLKPLLLAYRIDNLEKGTTVLQQASLIKKSSITLVEECDYLFWDNNYSLEISEFINDGTAFTIRVDKNYSKKDLLKNSRFSDSFAEIVCIIFKVNGLKNEFRNVLRNEISDTKHVINCDLRVGVLEEAFTHLGISHFELTFWERVFKEKGLTFDEAKYESTPSQYIKNSIDLLLPSTYNRIDFDDLSSPEGIELLKLIVLPLEKIYPKGISECHIASLKTIKLKEFDLFRNLLWSQLSNRSQKDQEQYIYKYQLFELDNWILLIADEYRFILSVDYKTILYAEILKNFGVNMNTQLENIDISNKYGELLSKYGIINTAEIIETEIKSLLYFNNNEKIIEDYLKSLIKGNSSEIIEEVMDISKIIVSDCNLYNNGNTLNIKTNNLPWNGQNGISDKRKKQIGRNAEQKVMEWLKQQIGYTVNGVSSNSNSLIGNDNKHYDIEYINQSGELKYVEVKAVTGNSFIISRSEVEFGMEHANDFELALVEGDTINWVKHLFKFDDENSLERNNKFLAITKDYYFTFSKVSL